LYRSTW